MGIDGKSNKPLRCTIVRYTYLGAMAMAVAAIGLLIIRAALNGFLRDEIIAIVIQMSA